MTLGNFHTKRKEIDFAIHLVSSPCLARLPLSALEEAVASRSIERQHIENETFLRSLTLASSKTAELHPTTNGVNLVPSG